MWKYTGDHTLPQDPDLLAALFRACAPRDDGFVYPTTGYLTDLTLTTRLAHAWTAHYGLAMVEEYDARCKFPHGIHIYTRRCREVASAWTDADGGQCLAIILAVLAADKAIVAPPTAKAEPPKGGL